MHQTRRGQRPKFAGLSVLYLLLMTASSAAALDDYSLFEVGQVRPLAIDSKAKYLYAVNTPDDRLEIFKVDDGMPFLVGSVAVGMRPVAVATRGDEEVWVVNHLSDSVSVVDVRNPKRARVVRTLLVGDDPRDIVFAGPGGDRAFITTAHRGQNVPYDPQLTTSSVPRADVWVFDANDLGNSLEGEPLNIVHLFSDTPRALAVSPDGSTVYAAAFFSGNQTTVLSEGATANFDEVNSVNSYGVHQPHTGLIAKWEDGFWIDSLGRDVSHLVQHTLPDYDVFTLDAMATVPDQVEGPGAVFSGVGTTLFNMTVNPVTGALYVSNTEALNHVRFEGHGYPDQDASTVLGHIAESRVTVIKNGQVAPVHLNKHLDYDTQTGDKEASLASPRTMLVSGDGSTLYVAAHGSSKVGVFDTNELETDTFVPSADDHIVLSGGGPTGMVLDEKRGRMYVLTRFDNAIAVLDTAARAELGSVAMHTPEDASITSGRPVLYDAYQSSKLGDSSCASCHIDGGLDQLAWDLGDPNAVLGDMPGTSVPLMLAALQSPTASPAFAFALPICTTVPAGIPCTKDESQDRFDSNKGPMTTQTLKGMDNHGPMHWRGDRTAGTKDLPGAQPDFGMFDEHFAFESFNVAFPGLLGREGEVPEEVMTAFGDFMLQAMLPPNPVRNLDNSLTPEQEQGRSIYFGGPEGDRLTDTVRTCNGCHTLDVLGNAEYDVERPGFFGTDGRFSFESLSQMFKIPQLRNAYDKVGMFGGSGDPTKPISQNELAALTYLQFEGDQVRGFGYSHDGSTPRMFDFFGGNVFQDFGDLSELFGNANPDGFKPYVPPEPIAALEHDLGADDPLVMGLKKFNTFEGWQERAALEAFVLAFDSNFLPIVGQQVTLGQGSGADVEARLDLLEAQAAVTAPREACDLIATGRVDKYEVGYLYDPATHSFATSLGGAPVADALLRAQATQGADSALTFTCVPPGAGYRRAIDRDRDGYPNTQEVIACSDPADGSVVPAANPPEDCGE